MSQPNTLIGKTLLGRYSVVEFIGQGGTAQVYKVWDSRRTTHLAMKILREDIALDRVFLRRFKREAQTLATLQHPNIVRFYDLEQDDFLAFILMDYVEGSTLKHEIFRQHRPIPMERVLEIMRPVCSALHFAHHQGLVHCDVKPANIMIHRNGTVLLTDFGIARMTESVTTATMVGAGTPAYMAPEQIRGEDPSAQTDIYSLGVVLYEMLTGGERPFTGEHARTSGTTGEKVLWEHLNLQPPSPRQFNKAISPRLEKTILRCLIKPPEGRFASSLDLLNQLGTGTSSGSAPAPSWTDSSQPPDAGQQPPAGEEPHVGGPKWRVIAGVAGALILVGAAGAALAFTGRGRQAPTVGLLPTGALTSTNTPPPTVTRAPAEAQTLPAPAPSAAPSGSAGQIAFSSNRDGSFQIYVMDSSGGGLTRLTNNSGDDRSPAWSPDGKRIAFVMESSSSRIYLMDADGNNQTLLDTGGASLHPAWSPDGRRLAFSYLFSSAFGSTWDIVAMDIDGGKPADLVGASGNQAHATWSPDGLRIAYDAGPGGIGIINADGSNRASLTSSPQSGYYPVWSPDGTRIAFVSNRDGNYEIYTMNADGSAQTRLTDDPANDLQPTWSPDGKKLAFSSNRDGNAQIYMMNADGSAVIRLTNSSANDLEPAWSPAR